MREFTVVINECEQPALPNVLGIRTRNTANGEKNLTTNFDKLAAGLPAVLTERQLDWLDVMGAIFAIDNACERGQGDTDWARDMTAFVPVRDPTLWEDWAIELQELFGDLTFDRLRLHFRPDRSAAGPPRQGAEHPECDCVALLSGGVDSYTGVLALLESGRHPLLISHNNPGTARYQRAAEAGACPPSSSSPSAPIRIARVACSLGTRGPSAREPCCSWASPRLPPSRSGSTRSTCLRTASWRSTYR